MTLEYMDKVDILWREREERMSEPYETIKRAWKSLLAIRLEVPKEVADAHEATIVAAFTAYEDALKQAALELDEAANIIAGADRARAALLFREAALRAREVGCRPIEEVAKE